MYFISFLNRFAVLKRFPVFLNLVSSGKKDSFFLTVSSYISTRYFLEIKKLFSSFELVLVIIFVIFATQTDEIYDEIFHRKRLEP